MSGFKYCKWCHGTGCLACDGEEIKHNEIVTTENIKKGKGPTLMMVVDLENERELNQLKSMLGAKEIERAMKAAGNDMEKFTDSIHVKAEKFRIKKELGGFRE